MRKGFTLVEVLVALAIMAVLAALAWRGLDGMIRARDGSQAQLERTLRLATVIAQWDQDLQALQETGVVPALSFDGATLRLTRSGGDGMQLVAWSLQGGRWQRWASPAATRVGALQDNWLRSLQLLGDEPGQLRLLDDVDQLQLYFYRGNGWSNAQSSGDVAESGGRAPAEALPTGVRLVLTIAGRTLTRDLLLATRTP